MPDAPPAAPLAETQRLRSLDILRGVAVLGIFVMNSRNFAFPLNDFDNPAFPNRPGSPAHAADLWTWSLSNILFEDKMIAIFSMLFGAGVVLNADRLGRTLRAAAIHYRRMFWLFLFGLIHAFGLWYGDILNTYAICGVLLFPLHRLRPGALIGLGILILTVSVWVRMGPRAWAVFDDPSVTTARSADQSPVPPPESTQDRIWRESIENEHSAYHGTYLDLFRWRAKLNIVWHWYGCINFNFWRCGGFMLLGMGLVPILTGSRPGSVSWGLMIGGYAAGLLMIGLGFWPQLARALGRASQSSPESRQMLGALAWTLRFLGAGFLALGHVGLILLLCRARSLRLPLAPLAAVGRMALSNYLLQTLTAVFIFDGWALGNWGTWGMATVATLVISVWLAQLILSPIWLRFFRFGPAEWLGRTLTYWKLQPALRTTAS